MRWIAKVVGVLFIVGTLYAFVDTGFGMDTTMLLGLFPVNALLNIVHLGLGVWSYSSSRAGASSEESSRGGGVGSAGSSAARSAWPGS